jgi:integrase
MTTKLEEKQPKTKPNNSQAQSADQDFKEKTVKTQIKPKLVHKEYEGTSEKIRKYLSYNHEEPARNQYYFRLTDLDNFVSSTYHNGVDEVLNKIESEKFYIINNNNHNNNNHKKIPVDQYDFMGSYLNYLNNKTKRNGEKLAASTIHDHLTTAKTLVEAETRIKFNDTLYSTKVKPKKIIKGLKLPLSRATILKLINGCTKPNQQRLRMILLLSACGSRIGESLLLRLSDLHLDDFDDFGSQPPYYPYIHFRGEITKTGKPRITLLTNEMAAQLRLWIKGRYATRNRTSFDSNVGKYKTVKHTPEKNQEDFLFLDIDKSYKGKDAAYFAYNDVLQRFHGLLKDLELDHRSSNGQRAITPHKIRMAVRTEISNLVTDKDFPLFYIGHDTDTYYNPTPERYKEQFGLCQSALTYLDQTSIIRSHGNLETRIDNIEVDQIAELKKQIAQIQQENKEREQRLISLIVKESIVEKTAIPKKNLDLIFSGDLNAIPFSVCNREGNDVKDFIINKDIESIKNNYEKESKKLKSKVTPKSKATLHLLEDPPGAFLQSNNNSNNKKRMNVD